MAWRRAAAWVVLAAVLGGCASVPGRALAPPTSSASTAGASGGPAPPLTWSACQAGAGPAGYQCATVAVPLNPARPGGPMINVALDRHVATGARIGDLLVNPGGPGVSGVDALPGIVGELGPSLLAHFDVVGFDPPGVGHSDPVTCLGPAGLAAYFHVDPAPASPSGFSALVAADRTFAAGCKARSGAVLPYVSTADAARDMDHIRLALGEAKLTYLGLSYGTLLGATYAELFPTHVRAMVLDGALDPALATVPQLDQQSASLEAQLKQFFAACAAGSGCAWRPAGGAAAAFGALLALVRTSPLPVPGTGRTVGPSELLYGTAAALYTPATWGYLGQVLAAASAGDGAPILSLFDSYTGRRADGSYSNLFEANAAVNCLDAPAPPLSQLRADASAAERVAPVFGLQNLYSEAGCTVWPVRATGRPHPIHAAGSPPIVVVGSTGDPITPYAWAQALAGQLAHGRLLTRVGNGHTGYGASPCIRAHVDAYLVSLVLPPPGTRCPSG